MKKLFVIIATILLLPGISQADSMFLVEQGASGTGKAGILADSVRDGSALFYNPAALSLVRTTDFEATVGLHFPSLSYSTESSNQYDASKNVLIPGSMFFTLPMGQKMTLGLGVTTPTDINNSWGDDFPGRFSASKYQLMTNALSIGVGYQLSSRFRVGASVDYNTTSLKFENHLVAPYYNFLGGEDNNLLGFYETVGAVDESDTGTGFTVGMSWNVLEKWSVSLVYKSEVDFEFSDMPVVFSQHSLLNIPNAVEAFNREFGEINATMNSVLQMPASATIGVSYHPSNRWIIEIDLATYMFSDLEVPFFDYMNAPVSAVDRGMTEKWSDMNLYGFSLDYTATKKIRITGGMRYASDTIPYDDMSPAMPSSEKFWISLGLSYLDEGNGWSLALQFKSYRDHTVTGQEDQINPLEPGYLEHLDTSGLYDLNETGFAITYHHRF
ncbi:MAG: hypothetical protein GXO70_11880 [Acidobacteria bacterium]|nr:hypothetical protein [Acidobacteriota bacterium]